MQIEDGPAAVTGDTTCIVPLTFVYVGKAQEKNTRKSENLPESIVVITVVDYR